MSKPSENMNNVPDGFRHLSRGLLSRASILVLLVPITAMSGVTNTDIAGVPPQPTEPAKSTSPGAAYQLRCWQDGRLLFEESHVALPQSDSANYRIKLAATDRRGQPIYIAETANATCLISKPPAERGWGK
jgi:hypothetical protein